MTGRPTLKKWFAYLVHKQALPPPRFLLLHSVGFILTCGPALRCGVTDNIDLSITNVNEEWASDDSASPADEQTQARLIQRREARNGQHKLRHLHQHLSTHAAAAAVPDEQAEQSRE